MMEKRLQMTVILVLVLGFSLFAAGCPSPRPATLPETTLPTFASAEEFIEAFRNGTQGYRYLDAAIPQAQELSAGSMGETKGPEHSTTNVQVEGVDEADTVKTDGEFIYAISGNAVCIVRAYPPQDMQLVSRIPFDDNVNLSEMFVNGDRLAVIAYVYPDFQGAAQDKPEIYPSQQFASLEIYDISDRGAPRLLNTVEHEGSYMTSRMIGDNLYVILTSYPYIMYDDVEPQPNELVPLYRTAAGDKEPSEFAPACDWSQVEYIEPEACTSFLSILSMSLADGGSSVEKREIAGNAECVYASAENLYVTAADYWRFPYVEEESEASSETVHSTVHKFRFDGAGVGYLASAEVPGTVLNQFSMDESNGYFRIATTGYENSGSFKPTNNVYILDPSLNITGRLEGLASGETIYSARFMGNRGYLVTFEKVDPFFVLDLSNPTAPKVLGQLKIPGYSNYLHPYDENHVIGVGKNAVEADPSEGDFAWYQGMKVALFDVTNVFEPKEMYKVDIGDRGTDSYALFDHKAFLFDREKELLVLPILLAELTPEQKTIDDDTMWPDYGEYTYQGAYVYDISLGGGINLRGRISHIEDISELTDDEYYYYYDSDKCIQRSLYIGDSLYTVSRYGIKANDIGTLGEQAFVTLEQ